MASFFSLDQSGLPIWVIMYVGAQSLDFRASRNFSLCSPDSSQSWSMGDVEGSSMILDFRFAIWDCSSSEDCSGGAPSLADGASALPGTEGGILWGRGGIVAEVADGLLPGH